MKPARLRPLQWSLVLVCSMVAFLTARLVTFPTNFSSPPDMFEAPPTTNQETNRIQVPTKQQAKGLFSVNDLWWCEGSRFGSEPEGRNFHHFPHAMEFVARCWSWFLDNDAYPGRCGIVLDGFIKKKLLNKANTDWVVKFLEITGCELRVVEEIDDLTHNVTHTFAPDLKQRNDLMKHTWVNKPEHAWALRDLLLQHYGIPLQARRNTTVRIGFVDRPDSRRVTNMREIMMEITSLYDNVVLDLTWFTGATPMEEQIAWFANHDVIIGAHGASMTNCLFLQPETVVIEIFPKNYFPVDFFGSLITDVAGVHLPLYADHHLSNETQFPQRKNLQAGIAAHKEVPQAMSERHKWRNRDITAHVDDVIYLAERGMKSILGTWPQHLDGTITGLGRRKIAIMYKLVRKELYMNRVHSLLNSTRDRMVDELHK